MREIVYQCTEWGPGAWCLIMIVFTACVCTFAWVASKCGDD